MCAMVMKGEIMKRMKMTDSNPYQMVKYDSATIHPTEQTARSIEFLEIYAVKPSTGSVSAI